MAGYDLHMHSLASDGRLPAAKLVEEAVALGLQGIALTDHDNVAGLSEAIAAAEARDLEFIPGVEFTTDYGDQEAHILGYEIDYTLPELTHKFQIIKTARLERAREIVMKLNRQGLPLVWEQVEPCLKQQGFVGRPAIFQLMEKNNLVDPLQRNKYFDYYLGSNGVAYVPHYEIETAEAIALILKAGGVPVLAHPGRQGNEGLIAELVDCGLQGLEVYYPTHSAEMIDGYLKLAEKYDLYVTGGSDFHGDPVHAPLGATVVAKIPWRR